MATNSLGSEEIELMPRTNKVSPEDASSIPEAVNRNIIIIGKTGVGKATVANAIVGLTEFNVSGPIHGATRLIQGNITKQMQVGEYNYKITLIDTVGVQDDDRSQLPARIKEALESNGSTHLILFVYKEDRFSREEKETFDDVIKTLREVRSSHNVALVVTCCELESDEERESIKESLSEESSMTSEIAHFAKKILLVGLPRIDSLLDHIRPYIEQRSRKDRIKLQDLAKTFCEEELFAAAEHTASSTEKSTTLKGDELGGSTAY